MSKDQKKNDKQKVGWLTPDKKRMAKHLMAALLVPVSVALLLWQFWVKPQGEQLFEKNLQQLAQDQQSHVASYLQAIRAALKNETASAVVNEWLLDFTLGRTSRPETLIQFQNEIEQLIPGTKNVKLYFPGQAQAAKDSGAAIGFVELYMVNRAELGEDVFPEVSKHAATDQWLINWVMPVKEQDSQELQAVLFVTTSSETLTNRLTNYNQRLAQTQLIQRVGRDRELTFFTTGQAGRSLSVQKSVPQSHWQLQMVASPLLYSQSLTPPWWYFLVVVLSAVGSLGYAWKVAKQKNEYEASLYKVLEVAKSKPTEDKPEKETVPSNPLYMTDEGFEIEEEDEALVAGAHQQKQNQSKGSSSAATVTSVSAQADDAKSSDTPATIFRAYDIRGLVDTELTAEVATAVGKAVASEALEQGEHSLLIGYDARTHSPVLFEALREGVLSTGCNVIELGLVPTPLMNFAAAMSEETSSGIMVTASHNPKEYNGFKLLINGKTLADEEVQAIRERISSGRFVVGETGTVTQQDFAQDYIDTVAADIVIDMGVKVVVDAANGAASQLAPDLLSELGCEVTPLYCEFDGEFPNHDPDPSIVANLQPLIQTVKDQKADLGLALDGDGDRLVVITASGKIIWPDQLLMLFARDVVSRNPGCDVIFDVKSTRHLNQVVASYGGRPVMWKTGHSHIKAKMQETEALLAGEYSGHIFFRERWYGFDDGLYAACRLLEIMTLRDESLDDMLDAVPDAVATPEIKIPVDEASKFALVEKLIEVGDFASGEITDIDGLRVDFDKGWGLVRASNTSPALTLRFEAENENGVEQLKTLFKRELRKIDQQIPLDF